MSYADYIAEQFTVGDLHVKIIPDQDAESPREWDNLGTMVCWHRRYNLGDKHSFQTPEDFRESLEYLDAAVILPLYLYDHSGITISCEAFSCPWDSGQVGYIYIPKDKVRKEYGCKRISKKRLAKVAEYLKSEVETYDLYLTGQVYGYVVETKDGETVDSCWGFFGLKEAMREGREQAEYWNKEHAKVDTLGLEANV